MLLIIYWIKPNHFVIGHLFAFYLYVTIFYSLLLIFSRHSFPFPFTYLLHSVPSENPISLGLIIVRCILYLLFERMTSKLMVFIWWNMADKQFKLKTIQLVQNRCVTHIRFDKCLTLFFSFSLQPNVLQSFIHELEEKFL